MSWGGHPDTPSHVRSRSQLGTGTLPISFTEMKEAGVYEFPNVELIGPNGGEVIGYLHLKLTYRTHSRLGRNVRFAML